MFSMRRGVVAAVNTVNHCRSADTAELSTLQFHVHCSRLSRTKPTPGHTDSSLPSLPGCPSPHQSTCPRRPAPPAPANPHPATHPHLWFRSPPRAPRPAPAGSGSPSQTGSHAAAAPAPRRWVGGGGAAPYAPRRATGAPHDGGAAGRAGAPGPAGRRLGRGAAWAGGARNGYWWAAQGLLLLLLLLLVHLLPGCWCRLRCLRHLGPPTRRPPRYLRHRHRRCRAQTAASSDRNSKMGQYMLYCTACQ